MSGYDITLRRAGNSYRLSLEAQRLHRRIFSHYRHILGAAPLLGYMINEFHNNGANTRICNDWLSNNLYYFANINDITDHELVKNVYLTYCLTNDTVDNK